MSFIEPGGSHRLGQSFAGSNSKPLVLPGACAKLFALPWAARNDATLSLALPGAGASGFASSTNISSSAKCSAKLLYVCQRWLYMAPYAIWLCPRGSPLRRAPNRSSGWPHLKRNALRAPMPKILSCARQHTCMLPKKNCWFSPSSRSANIMSLFSLVVFSKGYKTLQSS